MPNSYQSLQQQLETLLQQAIEEKLFPGAAVAVVTPTGELFVCAGHSRYLPEEDKRSQSRDDLPLNATTPRQVVAAARQTPATRPAAITPTSLFDVASITKSIPTSLLLLQLVSSGQATLQTPLLALLPELGTRYKNVVRLWHLVTFTLDFDIRLSALKHHPPDDLLATLLAAELRVPPGSSVDYVNATSILTTLVLERLTQKSLATLAAEKVFQPLGMEQTSFMPLTELAGGDSAKEQSIRQRLVPTEIDDWRERELVGEVHDESAWVLRPQRVVGSAGLFSCVEDLAKVARALLGQESALGLSEEVWQAMMRDQRLPRLPEQQAPVGLGWERVRPWMGTCSPTTLGKTGFTGCSFLVDFERQVGIILLSNHIYPKRREDKKAISSFRTKLHSHIFKHFDTIGQSIV